MSVIAGLYIIISLIIVSRKAIKNPKMEFIDALFECGFFIYAGAYLGMIVIPTVIIILSILYLP